VSLRRAGVTATAALAALLLAGLGIWQVERRAWKLDLIARTETKLAAQPVALPPRQAWSRIGTDDVYTRVRIEGQWLATKPVLVKAVTDVGPGWWVMSPLRTADGVVVVNRGFVPDDRRGAARPASGPAAMRGLLRLGEPGGAFLRHNDPASGRWFSRDVTVMARANGWGSVAPFFVDADRAPGGAWPRGGMTMVRFPNNHLVYALTWFALAGLAGWFAYRAARSGD
jgi:surfeit locus 1 family protein